MRARAKIVKRAPVVCGVAPVRTARAPEMLHHVLFTIEAFKRALKCIFLKIKALGQLRKAFVVTQCDPLRMGFGITNDVVSKVMSFFLNK